MFDSFYSYILYIHDEKILSSQNSSTHEITKVTLSSELDQSLVCDDHDPLPISVNNLASRDRVDLTSLNRWKAMKARLSFKKKKNLLDLACLTNDQPNGKQESVTEIDSF